MVRLLVCSTEGKRDIDADAPLDRIPLYVRAGSILPLGPEIEYADQKPAIRLNCAFFGVLNGAFDLYEDEGDNYNYENGALTIIPIRWDEATRTLLIDDRKGTFPGMPEGHTFNVVWVSQNHGTGETVETRIDKVIQYTGKRISVQAT